MHVLLALIAKSSSALAVIRMKRLLSIGSVLDPSLRPQASPFPQLKNAHSTLPRHLVPQLAASLHCGVWAWPGVGTVISPFFLPFSGGVGGLSRACEGVGVRRGCSVGGWRGQHAEGSAFTSHPSSCTGTAAPPHLRRAQCGTEARHQKLIN